MAHFSFHAAFIYPAVIGAGLNEKSWIQLGISCWRSTVCSPQRWCYKIVRSKLLLQGYEWRIRFDELKLSTILLRGLPSKSNYTIYNTFWIKRLPAESLTPSCISVLNQCLLPWRFAIVISIFTKLEHKSWYDSGDAVDLFDEKWSCYCMKTTTGIACLQQEQQKQKTPPRGTFCFSSFYFIILEAAIW